MSGLVESATAIMQMAARRLDIVAGNVANVSTSGYKRQIGFAEYVSNRSASLDDVPSISTREDMAQAKLEATGNPLDLAINGDGMFAVRTGETLLYSRQGQFHRTADGTLATTQGYILQQAGGGDVVVGSNAVNVLEDGTIIDNGRPVARVGLWRAGEGTKLSSTGGSYFSADGTVEEAIGGSVRSGMLEGSNVSLGEEMTASMLALRQAESGARLVQLYDDLMGRAVTTFGRSAQ